MKTLALTGIIMLPIVVFSQGGRGWERITDKKARMSFSLPSTPVIFDSMNTRMYANPVDSLLALQVHVFDSAHFNFSETILNEALRQEKNDTLRAIAKLTLLATNSKLTAISDMITSGNRGLEIGIEYQTLASNIPYLTFIRYYVADNRFISFTLTGATDDLLRLLAYKKKFFNSISFE